MTWPTSPTPNGRSPNAGSILAAGASAWRRSVATLGLVAASGGQIRFATSSGRSVLVGRVSGDDTAACASRTLPDLGASADAWESLSRRVQLLRLRPLGSTALAAFGRSTRPGRLGSAARGRRGRRRRRAERREGAGVGRGSGDISVHTRRIERRDMVPAISRPDPEPGRRWWRENPPWQTMSQTVNSWTMEPLVGRVRECELIESVLTNARRLIAANLRGTMPGRKIQPPRAPKAALRGPTRSIRCCGPTVAAGSGRARQYHIRETPLAGGLNGLS